MSKTSKKRGFPKISKWGKFLRLRRSKKKEKKTTCEEEKVGHEELEVNKTQKEQETTALIVEKTTENNVPELKEENMKLEEQIKSENCSPEEKKEAVKVDLCQKFVQEETSEIKHGGSSHALDDKKTELEDTEMANENEIEQNNDKDIRLEDNLNSSPKEVKESPRLDQISNVIIHTPSPKQPQKPDVKINFDEKDEELAFPILSTPSPKNKTSDVQMQKVLTVKKKKNDVDEDGIFVAASPASTPSQKKSEHRESRILTVKKIRSIIATPYKRLKREGSLVDGQTYRYIEIQSLVNAFQSMHPCIGSMFACNEKGLQYGKSSVLRIECKECNTKVFLQASKN